MMGAGDDNLLLHRVTRRTSWRVGFAPGEEAAVPTEPADSWRDMIGVWVQHAPWMRNYPPAVQVLGLLLWIVNLVTVVLMIGILIGVAAAWAVILVGVKLLMDYWMMRRGAKVLGRGPRLSWWLPLVFTMHSCYRVVVGLVGLRQRFARKIREFGR